MRYFVPAEPNELQVDIDSTASLKRFREMLKMLKQSFHVTVKRVYVKRSKTKGHYHASIFLLENLEPMERVLLQAILGSDPVREILSWGRIKNDDPYPILFIEKGKGPGIFWTCTCKEVRCKCLRTIQNSHSAFEAGVTIR